MKALKIEMIHDVVCSWCPIGYANLKQALKNLAIEADISFLPSELNPGMGPKGATQLLVDVLNKNPATTFVVIDEVSIDN